MIHAVGLAQGDFRWWIAIPWILAGLSLATNVLLLVWTRCFWIRVRIDSYPGTGKGHEHKRFFVVEVLNLGAEIHDLTVRIEGKRDDQLFSHPLNVQGYLPNPMRFRQSRNFFYINHDPLTSCEWESLPAEAVTIAVMSGAVNAKRIKGRKFKPKLDAWSRIDETLPKKPDPPGSISSRDWILGRERW
jgi:hypothetical protein